MIGNRNLASGAPVKTLVLLNLVGFHLDNIDCPYGKYSDEKNYLYYFCTTGTNTIVTDNGLFWTLKKDNFNKKIIEVYKKPQGSR